MNPHVDLSQLSVRREAVSGSRAPPPRPWLTRYVLPLGILLAFAALLAWAARDQLLPAQAVTIIPVHVTRSVEEQAGTPLFTAAGWIEPSPFPIAVTALAEGVVEKLLVIDGQAVTEGQPLAQLIVRDAEIGLTHSRAEREMRAADLDSARAQFAAAETILARPAHLDAAVAEAEAMLIRSKTEQANLPLQIQVAEARVAIARQDLDGKKAAGDGIPVRALQRAQSEFDAAQAALGELKQRSPRLEQEVAAWERKVQAAQTQRELLTEEKRKVAEAKSNIASTLAKLHQAEALEEAAQLRLDRMIIKSPVAGRVLARVAREGTRLMGLKAESEQESSTVVTLYQPDKLQVRADVRLEDVPRVKLKQPVRIETAAVPEGLSGEVIIVTSAADIQKNTLQVKVLIHDPPPQIKPEMLVKVTFLATAEEQPSAVAQQRDHLFVPQTLVHSEGGQSYVWLADLTANVARRKAVTVGQPGKDGLVEVEGLSLTDKLIVAGREGLTDGARIRIRGEDHGAG